jgi:hypothetical protein
VRPEDVLAGPIVRRVEPGLVAVWLALRVPATVRLIVYRGVGRTDQVGIPLPRQPVAHPPGEPRGMPPDDRTFPAGARLHLAFAVWEPTAGSQLEAGEIYSYDVRVTPDDEPTETGLKELGLLDDRELRPAPDGPAHRHLALGYKKDVLPSFVVPPAQPFDLKIVHGSCRFMNGEGRDAMPVLDEILRAAQADRLARPHLCFLTGDQVYVDTSCPEFTALANAVGAELISGQPDTVIETLDVDLSEELAPPRQRFSFPADRHHFPPGRRHSFMRKLCGFSSGNMEGHVLGLGEVFATYLMHFSNVAWPSLDATLQSRWPRIEAYRTAVRDMVRQGKSRDGFRGIADWIPYHAAWRLVPDSARRLDALLTDADRAATWAPRPEDAAKWDTFWAGTAFTGAPKPDTSPEPLRGSVPDAARRLLARHVAPSYWAGYRHFGVDFDRSDLAQPADSIRVIRDRVRSRIHRLRYFYDFLPEVRRALANIATYMLFDDHEVTDDWNISANWVRAMRANSLGRAAVRNMLVGYALFQHWGNDPRAFVTDGPPRAMLRNIGRLFFDGETLRASVPDPEAAWSLETQFALEPPDPPPGGMPPGPPPRMRWHYRYDGPGFEVIALDSRTARGFEMEGGAASPFSADANAALLSEEALQMQVPREPPVGVNEGFSVVLAATPVIGMQPVEMFAQPVLNLIDELAPPPRGRWAHLERFYKYGRINYDPENFGYVQRLFEHLLARLSTRKRVIFLSGEVHYTFTSSMSYWADAEGGRETRFVQLTSSSLRNQRGAPQSDLFNIDLVQRVAELISSPIERLGWNRGLVGTPGFEKPLAAGATALNLRLLRAMEDDPIVVSPLAVPEDARLVRPPEWRWSIRLESDQRPDTERIPFLQDAPVLERDDADPGQVLLSAARRHAFQGQHVPPRRWLWWTNICLVEFVGDASARTLRHSALSFDVAGIEKTARAYTVVDVPLDTLGDRPALPQESP